MPRFCACSSTTAAPQHVQLTLWVSCCAWPGPAKAACRVLRPAVLLPSACDVFVYCGHSTLHGAMWQCFDCRLTHIAGVLLLRAAACAPWLLPCKVDQSRHGQTQHRQLLPSCVVVCAGDSNSTSTAAAPAQLQLGSCGLHVAPQPAKKLRSNLSHATHDNVNMQGISKWRGV